MKKIIAAFFILISAFEVNAQIEKGKILLGGDLAYGSHRNDLNSQKYQNGNFDISIGKAIKPNTIFGFSVTYSEYNYKNNSAIDTSTNGYHNFGAGVFYRKYKHLAKSFYLFGEGNALFQFGNTKAFYSGPSLGTVYGKSTGGTAGMAAGIAYKLCKKWQLEIALPELFTLQYSHTRLHYDTSPGIIYKANDITVTSAFSHSLLNYLEVGFRLVL